MSSRIARGVSIGILSALVGSISACSGGADQVEDSEVVASESEALSTALTGGLSVQYTSPASHLLQSGSVLILGNISSPVTQIYNPATGLWSPTGSMLTQRDSVASATLKDGRVLVVAGETMPPGGALSVRLASAEIYNPATGVWSAAGASSSPRVRHTATTLNDGRVLVTGGLDANGKSLASVDIFDPATSTWSAGAPLPVSLSLHSATLLADGRVLVVGGFNTTSFVATAAYLYNPVTNVWTATGPLLAGRYQHQAIRFADGRVLIASGNGTSYTAVTSSELYDPATGKFSAAGNMAAAHAYSFAGQLSNGDVLIGGGTSGAGDSTQLERYKLGVGWSVAGNLVIPRQKAATALLSSGKLLVAGGWSSTGQAPITSELLDDGPVAPPGTAVYDAALMAPKCAAVSSSCDTGTLVDGRGALGPELHASNTIHGSCADGVSGVYHSDESLDRLRVYTADNSPFAQGKTVTIEATVWAWWGYSSDALDLFSAPDANNPVWTWIGTVIPTNAGTGKLTATYALPAKSGLQAVRAAFRYGGPIGPCVAGSYTDRDDLVFMVP
jgi:hypothetical protein